MTYKIVILIIKKHQLPSNKHYKRKMLTTSGQETEAFISCCIPWKVAITEI